jgi:ribonuclease HI
MTSTVEIYFDGLCEPKNPGGIPVYAFAISDPATGQFLAERAGLAGEAWNESATHNLAEYVAPIKAVEWLRGHTSITKFTI